MYLESLLDIYWSKDFLLNVSAELLGVFLEVILITVIVGRYLDQREARRWNDAFAMRIKKLLEVHRDMPVYLASMALTADLDVPYKIAFWSDRAEERLRDALAFVPPRLFAPQYVAAEEYLDGIRELERRFANQELPLSVFRLLNARAEVLATATSQVNAEAYLWTEELLSSLEEPLKQAVW